MKYEALVLALGALLGTPPVASSQAVLMVDDDGMQCPGAARTIQDAVAAARRGTTILVCPGTYRRTVAITGHAKGALKLIAAGHEGEVVLQGDHTERDGFHLKDVDNVLIRGFTVRDFGFFTVTAAQWGDGNNIYLENADYNVIELNRVVNSDMNGIAVVNSANNIIQHNIAMADDQNLATRGIYVTGVRSANNSMRMNVLYSNNLAGVMLRDAGIGNVVTDNAVLGNGRYGIANLGTEGTRIEGNRVSYTRGFWGVTPRGDQPGIGIGVESSTAVTVVDNRLHNNTGLDIQWDGQGANSFETNGAPVFATIDFPGAVRTNARRPNDRGDVPGLYFDANGNQHGFLLSGGVFTQVDVPGAVDTRPQAVNNRGDMVGNFRDGEGKWHGFLLRDGQFSTIDPPDSSLDSANIAIGINDAGEIAGGFNGADGKTHSYLFSGGKYTIIDVPGAMSTAALGGINNRGDIGGHYRLPENPQRWFGYVLSQGKFTTVDFPQENTTTCVFGMNDHGELVGRWIDPGGRQHGYVFTRGAHLSIDPHGATYTWAVGINNRGLITGDYRDPQGKEHGFLMMRY